MLGPLGMVSDDWVWVEAEFLDLWYKSWRLRLAATMQALRRSLVRLARMRGEPAKRAR